MNLKLLRPHLLLCVIGMAAAILLAAAPAQAQDFIRNIRIEGTQRIEPTTVMSYVSLTPGDPFDAERLNTSLKNLFATGLFADVSLYQEGSDLVIVVAENPIVNEIRFEGNDKIKDENLEAETRIRPRTVLTRTRVQADVERLQELYRLSGRFSATIDPKIIKLDQNRVNLVFEIVEGPQTRISRISFIGNRRFDDADLQRVVRSKEERWWRILTSDDKYDPDRLGYDRELLRRYYMEHGYADFMVENAVAELTPERTSFFVTFTLNEGERYKVGDVKIVSNIEDVRAEEFESYITLIKDDWYKASEVEKTIARVTEELGNRQYAFVDVTPGVERRREERVVDLTFTINESRKIFVGDINVSGNMRTLDEVVRREVTLMEGDPFNAAKLRRSEQRLRDLDYFEKVEVKTVPSVEPDKTDIDITVAEKSTGELSLGAGYSTSDGALGDFRLRERNFLGKGQDLAFRTTLSSRRTEFDVSFTEPYFLRRDLSAGIDLFHITRDFQDESSYDLRRTGTRLRLGYPLADKWRQTLSYGFEDLEISDVKPSASIYIREQEGQRVKSFIGQRLTYDTLDSRQDPTEGMNAWFDTELAGLGGDVRYGKVRTGAVYYVPFRDNKWVLATLGEAGAVAGIGDDVRINDRFYIGGATLRGFDDAGIGPRDEATEDALGGNRFWRATTELAFPSGLPEDLGMRFHTFADVGSLSGLDGDGAGIVGGDSIRAALGFGLAWRSPMGPVRMDFGFPIAKEEDDQTQVFRFSFGTRL